MRKIKIGIMTGCVLIGLVGIGEGSLVGQESNPAPPSGEQTRPHRGRVERELQRMRETLSLSDDQVARIRPILQIRNKQLDALRAESMMPQGEARAKATAIRKSARQQINQILTPEQIEKQRAMRRGKRTGNGQPGN